MTHWFVWPVWTDSLVHFLWSPQSSAAPSEHNLKDTQINKRNIMHVYIIQIKGDIDQIKTSNNRRFTSEHLQFVDHFSLLQHFLPPLSQLHLVVRRSMLKPLHMHLEHLKSFYVEQEKTYFYLRPSCPQLPLPLPFV